LRDATMQAGTLSTGSGQQNWEGRALWPEVTAKHCDDGVFDRNAACQRDFRSVSAWLPTLELAEELPRFLRAPAAVRLAGIGERSVVAIERTELQSVRHPPVAGAPPVAVEPPVPGGGFGVEESQDTAMVIDAAKATNNRMTDRARDMGPP